MDKKTPMRYSRHYYDLAKMAEMPCAESAIINLKVLANVVEFKERFYRAPWSNLADAKPGSFRLFPPEDDENVNTLAERLAFRTRTSCAHPPSRFKRLPLPSLAALPPGRGDSGFFQPVGFASFAGQTKKPTGLHQSVCI